LIKALVVGNTWAWPVNGDLHFEAFSRIMGGALGRHFIVRNNAFVNLMMPAGTPKSRLSPEILGIYRDALPPERRAASAVFPREILASRQYLAAVERGLPVLKDKPALIVWGNKDVAFRDKERRRFEAQFADRRTAILDGAGHYIQEESPAEIVDAIRSWIPTA
jgi:haloalkane dehalogenase